MNPSPVIIMRSMRLAQCPKTTPMPPFFSIPRPTSNTPNLIIRPYRSPPDSKPAFAALLRSLQTPQKLKQLHSLILTSGLSHKNSLLTLLLQSLSLAGDMNYARNLFDEMHKPRVFLWNTLIRAYVNNGLPADALPLYLRMHSLGVRPDNFTFPFVLKACAELLHLWFGMSVHAVIVKFNLDSDLIIGTEVTVMYAKFGDSESADRMFEDNGDRKDLVLWNALISAYAQSGNANKALVLFRRMEADGIEPNSITFVSALSACAYLGCLEFGRSLHLCAKNRRIRNVFVENALLDMYSKCGSMEEASQVFMEMGDRRNVISWSTMINGYAVNGDCEAALSLFSRMRDDGVEPNYVTMLAVLTACSHAGLVSEGKAYFFSITHPRIEHYASMVDLLGRSGHLEEAFDFIKSMPIKPDTAVWGALLGACTVFRDTKLGELAADELFKLAPETPSYQVLISNMYAALGRWEDVEKVREHMRGSKLKKVAAYSSVELDGEVHVFFEGSHSWNKGIYKKLDELNGILRRMGYAPETSVVLHDVEVEEKEAAVRTHSEKLAIAFSVISSNKSTPIRIMKNLRICSDCHTFSKYVSRAIGREIIMRDKNRFHHFRDGECSCRDFW